MKVFVTGVNGQLGRDVILELNKRHIEALASDLSNSQYNLDITDSNQVNKLLLSLKPDVIIHCAAYTQVDKAEEDKDTCYRVNVIGTKNLIEVAKKLDSKFIYISTDYVFGDDTDIPHKPDDTNFNPLNVYGFTKLEGEKIVSKELSKYYIVRTSWVYGLNGNNFVKTMLKLSETHSELRVVDDQIGSPTNTKDLSRLLVDMALSDKYGYYNATNEGDYISWADFASKIFELAHKDTKVIPVTTKEYGQSKAIRPLNSRLDKYKLKDFGFEQFPNWKESLSMYLKEINKPKTVDILLSTYNGEKYLRDLLDSLSNQTYKHIHIIVRDDMSTDGTVTILKEYIEKNKDLIELIPSNRNLGYIASFEELVKHSKSKYTIFCDQDDVWFEDKIEKYVIKMKEVESKQNNNPILLTSEVELVDKILKSTGRGWFEAQRIYPKELNKANVLSWPQGLGWTLMFNENLRKIVRFPDVKYQISHDIWMIITAKYFGDYIMIEEATGLYRQTGKNVVGYKIDNSVKHYIDMYKYSKNKLMCEVRERAKLFLNIYQDLLSEDDKKLISLYIHLNEYNILKKHIYIRKYEMKVNGLKHNLPILFY